MYPTYATHYAGVGGVCIDPVNETILVIQEKNGRDKGIWKIPGGQIDQGEFVKEAAEREVLEETEIKSKCLGIIGFRETREYIHKRSDIYFVALLRPAHPNQQIGTGDGEVAKCMWVDIDQYINLDWKHPTQTTIKNAVVGIIAGIREFKQAMGCSEEGQKGLQNLETYYYVDPKTGDMYPKWGGDYVMANKLLPSWQTAKMIQDKKPQVFHSFSIIPKYNL